MRYLFFLLAIIFLFGCTEVFKETKTRLKYDSCQDYCKDQPSDIGCFANTRFVLVSSGDLPDCSCSFRCDSLDVAIKVSDLRCEASGGKCFETCDNKTGMGKVDCYDGTICCK